MKLERISIIPNVCRACSFPRIIFLFFCLLSFNFLSAQKLYYGYGITWNLASMTKIDYKYLSESDYFFEPLKVTKQTQMKAISNNIMRLELAGGLQLKRTFLELNIVPYYSKSFVFNVEGADVQGGALKEKKINYSFASSDAHFRLKHVLTGRKNTRFAGVIGISNAFVYYKETKVDNLAIDFDLFKFDRKFYQSALVGLEYIGYNGENNIMVGVYYEHQLSKFSDKITNGYLQLGFKYFMYHDLKKRQVYVHD